MPPLWRISVVGNLPGDKKKVRVTNYQTHLFLARPLPSYLGGFTKKRCIFFLSFKRRPIVLSGDFLEKRRKNLWKTYVFRFKVQGKVLVLLNPKGGERWSKPPPPPGGGVAKNQRSISALGEYHSFMTSTPNKQIWRCSSGLNEARVALGKFTLQMMPRGWQCVLAESPNRTQTGAIPARPCGEIEEGRERAQPFPLNTAPQTSLPPTPPHAQVWGAPLYAICGDRRGMECPPPPCCWVCPKRTTAKEAVRLLTTLDWGLKAGALDPR